MSQLRIKERAYGKKRKEKIAKKAQDSRVRAVLRELHDLWLKSQEEK